MGTTFSNNCMDQACLKQIVHSIKNVKQKPRHLQLKQAQLHSERTDTLPVPGGPYNSKPLGHCRQG